MKNIIVYTLGLLLFVSCDAFDDIVSDLDENEAELESNYYIQEGWNSVQTQDFSEASGFFNYIILNSNNPDSSYQVTPEILFDAYHGFAWSNLFHSNTLYGDNNEAERLLYRDTSYDSFFVSDSILNTIDYSSEVFDYQCDILAGKIEYSDFKIRHYLSEFYASDGNEDYIDSIDWYSGYEFDVSTDLNDNGHIELGLETLIADMNSTCSNYDFPYAPIDINSINMILIKHYIREGMYSEAVSFINTLDIPTVNLEFNVQFDDFDDVNGEVYLIGDFLNKTIDLNDLYSMNTSGGESSVDYVGNIDLTPYLPCNFDNIETDDALRDELLDCVDTYFEGSSEVVFRYKYVNGDYSQSIYNQETNLSGECSDSEGYRTINLSTSQESSMILNSCFNSCSSSCFNN